MFGAIEPEQQIKPLGNLLSTYTYNGFEQLIGRVITNSGSANGTVYTVHDVFGNVLAELDGTGATVREYIWLPEAQIAPARGAGGRLDGGESPAPRQSVNRPLAVVSGVNTTPALLMVHVDQLNRPIKMTSAAGAVVWSAVYSPFVGAYTLTGTETNNARFPGQWFQLEAGLHYSWHRHYDPSLGRYTQPDPLGFVDGPSVYAYARSSSLVLSDKAGMATPGPPPTLQPPTPQDQICSVPWLSEHMNASPEVLECCKKHDDCYAQHKCTSQSWFGPQRSWVSPNKYCTPECGRCNRDVVACVAGAMAG